MHFQTTIYHTACLPTWAAFLCQPTEKGRKNTAAKQPPSMAALRGDPFSRKVTSKRRTNTGATPPIRFSRPIQLAASNLPNRHNEISFLARNADGTAISIPHPPRNVNQEIIPEQPAHINCCLQFSNALRPYCRGAIHGSRGAVRFRRNVE